MVDVDGGGVAYPEMQPSWLQNRYVRGALVALAGVGLYLGAGGCRSDEGAAPIPEVGTTAPGTAPGTVPKTGDVVVDPRSLREVFEGEVHPEELAFGEEARALMANAPQERSSAAHSDHTLKTEQELVGWLNGPDTRATPVKDRVRQAILDTCGSDEVDRHTIEGKGWLTMVVKPESQVFGTSYMSGNTMQFVDGYRQAGANDAYWLPVCVDGANEGKVVPDAMVRSDCGNAHQKPRIRIFRPGVPAAPPVTVTEQPPLPIHPPASGPPPEASQPPYSAVPTPGYPGRGHAEAVVERQVQEPQGGLDPTQHGTEVPQSSTGGKAPGGGNESVVSQPAPSAPKNPEYKPGTESQGTKAGTSNTPTAPESQTEGSGQTSDAGTDPGFPG